MQVRTFERYHAYQTLECSTSTAYGFLLCGINTSSESILIRSYLLFAQKTRSCRILVHLIYTKSKSDETRELSDLKFIPQK